MTGVEMGVDAAPCLNERFIYKALVILWAVPLILKRLPSSEKSISPPDCSTGVRFPA